MKPEWKSINGAATFGDTGYEVRVVERLKNSRPIRWGLYKDGERIGKLPFKHFTAAKATVELIVYGYAARDKLMDTSEIAKSNEPYKCIVIDSLPGNKS